MDTSDRHDNPLVHAAGHLKQWCPWRTEQRGQDRTKVPCTADGHRLNVARGSGLTYAEAAALLEEDRGQINGGQKGFSGAGFIFTTGDHYAGMDLDKCRDRETGKIEDWARVIVDRFPDTYWEISPSGTGLHGILIGAIPDEFRTGKGTGRRKGKIEIYHNGRFFTFTGNPLRNVEPRDYKEEFSQFVREEFQPDQGGAANINVQISSPADVEDLVAELRRASSGFDRLWRHDPDDKNGDVSAYDLAITIQALFLRPELTDDQLWGLIVAHRSEWGEKPGKEYRNGYIVATIQKARTYAAAGSVSPDDFPDSSGGGNRRNEAESRDGPEEVVPLDLFGNNEELLTWRPELFPKVILAGQVGL